MLDKKKHSKWGFTLLELLVVISIIGILMAIGAVAFSTGQKKSRDARMRGDVKSIQNAFEQYYSSTGYVYPNNCSVAALLALFPENKLPTSPKGVAYNCNSSSATYCVCAQLENADGNYGAADCSTAGTSYYCVKALQ